MFTTSGTTSMGADVIVAADGGGVDANAAVGTAAEATAAGGGTGAARRAAQPSLPRKFMSVDLPEGLPANRIAVERTILAFPSSSGPTLPWPLEIFLPFRSPPLFFFPSPHCPPRQAPSKWSPTESFFLTQTNKQTNENRRSRERGEEKGPPSSSRPPTCIASDNWRPLT